MITNKCLNCGLIYQKKYRTKYCSQKCFGLANGKNLLGDKNPAKREEVRAKITKSLTGKKLTPEHRKNLSKSHIGLPGFWKGKKRPQETIDKISMKKKGLKIWGGKRENMNWMKEERHPFWKGDGVGYSALHDWVKRKLGKPEKCEFCGREYLTGHKIVWANKSGKYLRDIDDWIRLCSKCHNTYDDIYTKVWKTRRSKNV